MQLLTDIHGLIIDMDGVLWKGNNALPGLIDFFQLLRNKQLPFVLATNNASLTQNQYVDKLQSMGVSVSTREVLTSSMATAHYLSQKKDPKKSSIFIIGEEGLRQPLTDKGFTLIDTFPDDHNKAADFVVSGLDRNLSWKKMADASLHLHAGATFIATNADTTLPTERGDVLGNGAILAALQAATQITPTVIGKPEAFMYQQAMEILGSRPEQTVAIGDRLNTDILGAVKAGIRSIMLLTGISSIEDLDSSNYQPTWVIPDLPSLTANLSKSLSIQ